MPAKVPFRVIHVSGQEENHKAVELNTHSPTTTGWQSSRFCLYPQDIVVQLEDRSRLRKIQILSHQYLIPTKIEFYVGDVPDGIPVTLQNARYTRLGYVALSDNEKTGYKARELKSVHVDALGVFLKFVIHKNHVNRHNLYNQVGLVALNVIGELQNDDTVYPQVADERESINDPALLGLFNRPDYISPLDDLAFDMYQDPEVAQVIRKLEFKKQEAVLQEKYDYAKKLKSAIQDLQKVGEKLGKFDVEKRQAVESEDFDRASLKKIQMDEYRLQVYKQLELYDLLDFSAPKQPVSHNKDLARQPTPPRLTELPSTPQHPINTSTTPRTPYDERPLPAIKHTKQNSDDQNDPTSPLPPTTPADERRLPAAKTPREEDEPPLAGEDASGNVTGEPEPMNETDQREAAIVIDVFGLPLASKAYSKTWSFREDALLEMYKLMQELTDSNEAKNMIKASVFLINKAIRDKVFAVYTAGLNLLKLILTDFVTTHKVGKADIIQTVEKTLPHLLQRTGETAVRTRDAAKTFIIEESKYPEVKPVHIVTQECVRPFKLTIAPRLALSRVEILDLLYREHGVQNSGLTVETMMRFLTTALQHTAGEVRERAERLIIVLYKDCGSPVKDHLPSDDMKTRKNVLYKLLFEAFDRIDGKPSQSEVKKQKLDQEQAKQKEIEALQHQLQNLKDMAAGKARKRLNSESSKPVDADAVKDGSPPKSKDKKEKRNQKNQKPKPPRDEDKPEGDDASIQIDQTCIFCGEKSEQFTEEGLDIHYWKSCAMLKRCSFCKQVVEIAGLTDHLLQECESREDFKKCPRCSEAIQAAEYDTHVAAKSCNPMESGKNHCPLCHQNFVQGEDGWKNHLMGREGCKQNVRRLQALNKPGAKPGGRAPPAATNKQGAKSNAPLQKPTKPTPRR